MSDNNELWEVAYRREDGKEIKTHIQGDRALGIFLQLVEITGGGLQSVIKQEGKNDQGKNLRKNQGAGNAETS